MRSVRMRTMLLTLLIYLHLYLQQTDSLVAPAPGGIRYRNACPKDLQSIAELCSLTFDGSFQWYQLGQQQKSVANFRQQFQDRYYNLVSKGAKHAMIVAVSDSYSGSNTSVNSNSNSNSGSSSSDSSSNSGSICGFVEIGTLPSPIAETTVWEGQEVRTNKEVPYLGNVAISTAYRRRGIASKLVRIGLKAVEKWGEEALYVAVDHSNTAAISMYEKLQFQLVLDERDLISRRADREPRIFMARQVIAKKSQQNSNSSDSRSDTNTS